MQLKKGWIRAYTLENLTVQSDNPYFQRSKRASFRASFSTDLKENENETSTTKTQLSWGAEVQLPNGPSNTKWTKVRTKQDEGFILSEHLVQIAYAKRKERAGKLKEIEMLTTSGSKKKLLWGDLVQITKFGADKCEVRARGRNGTIATDDLTDEPLLEVYFIDVAQGDGVLVRTPDGKHLLIDGGLERKKQQTGKNAADFTDWKFFIDYGHHSIKLESMMASHSDNDHYGGLHDLVRDDMLADRELDCLTVEIDTFHHPGLSRWSNVENADPPHSQGLGVIEEGAFTLLLDDREHAEKAVKSNTEKKLSGPWRSFIRDILENSTSTIFQRILINKDDLKDGKPLPLVWPSVGDCHIRILGPVSKTVNGKESLPDFGKKSFNTNGHSICLRVDYGSARILLTGDLNTESMKWLQACYGDRMGSWECDVAKACHHGSHDVSYNFLEKIKAAATVISSGDAEGHAHPRPEIVGASAMTGFTSIDRENDQLITPLIYMTEVERSVSLGAINRIDFRNVPVVGNKVSGAILGRNIDELNDKAYLSPEDKKALKSITDKDDIKEFIDDAVDKHKPVLKAMESDMQKNSTRVNFNITVPQGPVSSRNGDKRAWRARVMEKNHYGLVNVRTDGDLIMCATLNETEKKWVMHTFPARF